MKTDPPNGESRKWHLKSERRQPTLPGGKTVITEKSALAEPESRCRELAGQQVH
jgi:hypothetical protein